MMFPTRGKTGRVGWLRLLSVVLGLSDLARGNEIFGRVSAVQDDETIIVVTRAREEFKVRVAAVVPMGPLGNCGKRLTQLTLNRSVKVVWERRDRRRRVVGRVFLGTMDVGLALISEGLAAHAPSARREQSAQDWIVYEEAQARAKRKW